MGDCKHKYKGDPIPTKRIESGIGVVDLVDRYFNAYNGARIAEICKLLERKALKEDVTLGLSISGALTPAGLGSSCIVPLIENGFVDYISSTGANLYHDLHFALGYKLHKSSPFLDDVELKKEELIRIYDIVMDFDTLLKSDRFLYDILEHKEFEDNLSTSELHYYLGKYVSEVEEQNGTVGSTIIAAAYRAGVPVYCPSPGDSTIGLNIAAKNIANENFNMDFNVTADVNETAAIVYDAAQTGKNAVLILGGGSPKNFMLQTVPQVNEVLNVPLNGHNYFMQITDARADTGGLSGATPSEAVSWGKVHPGYLPDSVVAYVDTSLALPIITSYVLTKCAPRQHKRLYEKRRELVKKLTVKYKSLRGEI